MTPFHSPRFRRAAFAVSLLCAFQGRALAVTDSPGTAVFTTADVDVSTDLIKQEFTTTLQAGLPAKKVNKEFKKADLNRNFAVSLFEYLIYIRETRPPGKIELAFINADTSGDGQLGFWEFAGSGNPRAAGIEHIKQFLIADTDEDDGVDLEEFTRYKQGKSVPPAGASLLKFDLADQDDDGFVGYGEYTWVYNGQTKQIVMVKAFDRLDKNGDSWLTKDEWNPGAPRP